MKKIVSYILLVAGILGLSGCEKYLDTIPDNRTDINTPEKISELLVSAYPRANYSPFCELMSDNVGDNYEGSAQPIYSKPYFWADVLQDDNDSPQYYWFACYAAIASANQALESIAALGDTPNLAPQKGEALVARAYAHFMLVCLFSKFYDATTASTDPGIPYVTETEKVVIKQYDRKTVAYVYDMIEKDLLAGIPLIKDQVYKVAAYHFTQKAAYAFATRFYLFKRNYDKVIEYATKVAGTNGFAENMRDWNNDYSTQSFTEISYRYTLATEKANLLLAETGSYWARYWRSNRYMLTSNLGQALYFGSNPSGGFWSYSLFGSERGVFLPKYNEHFVRVSPTADIGNGYNMIPLFTTEEVLFNRAEAYLYKGNNDAAIADLNTFLSLRIENYNAAQHNLTVSKNNTFWGTTSTANALLNTILYFKRVEFMHEGLRWFDILRYKVRIVHNNIDGSSQTLLSNDLRKVLQIPQEAALSGVAANPR